MSSRNKVPAVGLLLALSGLFLGGCATTAQNSAFPVGAPRSPRPAGSPVQVFKDEAPTRKYEVVAKLNVHLEKTFFLHSAFEEVRPRLEDLARQHGADGVMQIEEKKSRLNETYIYNVTAMAIAFMGE